MIYRVWFDQSGYWLKISDMFSGQQINGDEVGIAEVRCMGFRNDIVTMWTNWVPAKELQRSLSRKVALTPACTAETITNPAIHFVKHHWFLWGFNLDKSALACKQDSNDSNFQKKSSKVTALYPCDIALYQIGCDYLRHSSLCLYIHIFLRCQSIKKLDCD